MNTLFKYTTVTIIPSKNINDPKNFLVQDLVSKRLILVPRFYFFYASEVLCDFTENLRLNFTHINNSFFYFFKKFNAIKIFNIISSRSSKKVFISNRVLSLKKKKLNLFINYEFFFFKFLQIFFNKKKLHRYKKKSKFYFSRIAQHNCLKLQNVGFLYFHYLKFHAEKSTQRNKKKIKK
jgi:hypothetical protein